MKKHLTLAAIAAALALVFGAAAAQEGAHVKPVKDYATTTIKPWLAEPIVVNAIKAQNVETAKLKDIEINRLDIGWMDRSNKELIDSKMNNELSTFLRQKKDAANGVIRDVRDGL